MIILVLRNVIITSKCEIYKPSNEYNSTPCLHCQATNLCFTEVLNGSYLCAYINNSRNHGLTKIGNSYVIIEGSMMIDSTQNLYREKDKVSLFLMSVARHKIISRLRNL